MVKNNFNDHQWVYESPDQGKTVYRRQLGNHYKEIVVNHQAIFGYVDYVRMTELSKTNSTLKKALENLQLIYYTIKDE